MCETIITTNLELKVQVDNFDTKCESFVVMPKTIIKREVLFDYIDLIVSLAGSFQLFLGLSFLSIIEIFFFILEFLLELFFGMVQFLMKKN